jgi:hypothetical protein
MSKKEDDTTKKLFKMLGESILYGSIQFSIGSVEMSSKFSVKNFSKDQETLQNAADALMDYIKISFIWTLGVTMLLFSKYGWKGAVSSIISNLIVVMWIYYSYMDAFKIAVKKNPSLKMPKLHIITPSVNDMNITS